MDKRVVISLRIAKEDNPTDLEVGLTETLLVQRLDNGTVMAINERRAQFGQGTTELTAILNYMKNRLGEAAE